MKAVSKQSGSADCGLYAITYITSIAFGLDHTLCVCLSNQLYMRPHLLNCFQEKEMSPFPMLRERRSSLTATTICIKVYCYCRCIDTGEKMVICDGQCGEWFHTKCALTSVFVGKEQYNYNYVTSHVHYIFSSTTNTLAGNTFDGFTIGDLLLD